ncbi:fimbrillin family protein [Butyricimonas sp.]|uniref:fimbrillin family protein n=1 Tax=Butyricimonas sp. TaxID=1969738 RepID=UPI0025BF3B30|nr:fimbrillin family protein [Butyricimonas sp.]
MKIIRLLIYICLGCSCERKELTSDVHVPLNLNISIASLGRGTTPLTDGAELGVYIAEDSPEGTYNGQSYQNIRAVVAEGRLELDKDIMLSSTNANIYVYYPYKTTFTDPRAMRVTTKASPDFLLGKIEGINNLNPDANIVLQHMYSIIRFKIRNLSGSTFYSSVLNVTLRNNEGYTNLSVTGKVDVKDCSIIPALPSAHAVSISFSPSYKISSDFPDDDDSISMTVIPTPVLSGEMILEVVFSPTSKRSFEIPPINWECGKIYTYNLSIN